MAIGLNTDTDPAVLGKNQFPVYRDLRMVNGSIEPRPLDEPYAPVTDQFVWENMGQMSYVLYDFGPDYGAHYIHCPLVGGQVRIRAKGEETDDSPLTFPAPTRSSPVYSLIDGWPTGMKVGDSLTYAYTYTRISPLFPPAESGFSKIVEGKVAQYAISVDTGTGQYPQVGDTFQKTGETATAQTIELMSSGTSGYDVASVQEAAWAAGTGISRFHYSTQQNYTDADTFQILRNGVVIATCGAQTNEVALNDSVVVTFHGMDVPITEAPEGVNVVTNYVLDQNSGEWRKISVFSPLTVHQIEGNFPYSDAGATLYPAFSGSVDAAGLVNDLRDISSETAQALAEHRGVLMVAVDRYVYPSEPYQPRWFPKVPGGQGRLDMGSTVVGMVSRPDWLEVYCTGGVKIVQGDYPNYVVGDVQTRLGASSGQGIVPTDTGTFFLVGDRIAPEVYEMRLNGQIQPLCGGQVREWLRLCEDFTQVILAASPTLLVVADQLPRDGDYVALCQDRDTGEWFEHLLRDRPVAFRYDRSDKVLVVKYGDDDFESLMTSEDPTEGWLIRSKTYTKGRRSKDLPSYVQFDMDGDALVTLSADGETLFAGTKVADVFEETELPLPARQAKEWWIQLEHAETGMSSLRGWSAYDL